MAALIAFIILAVLFSLAIVLGAGGVLFLIALVAAGLWLGMTYVGGRTPARAVRRTKREELLDSDRSVT